LTFDYLIIAGGKLPDSRCIRKLIKLCRQIVTVDAGAKGLFKLRVKPLLHVGDGDSLTKTELQKLKPKSTLVLSPRKNLSDLEFALQQLSPIKTKLVIGAHQDSEGRPDHGFLNLLLLMHSKNIFFADEKNWITNLSANSPLSFTSAKNTIFSIGLLRNSKLWIEGSAYDIKGVCFKSQTQGLSNISRKHRVRIKSESPGLLFVSSDITKTKIDGPVLRR
jgi:thiamine pyrophosphokinase